MSTETKNTDGELVELLNGKRIRRMRTDWLLKEKDSLDPQSPDYKVIKQELDNREPLEDQSDYVTVVARRNFNKAYK